MFGKTRPLLIGTVVTTLAAVAVFLARGGESARVSSGAPLIVPAAAPPRVYEATSAPTESPVSDDARGIAVPTSTVDRGVQLPEEGPLPLMGWIPSAERSVSPEAAAEIEKLLGNCIALLGYDKVMSLEMVRHVVIKRGDRVLTEFDAAVQYVRPGWTRVEFHWPNEPAVVEVFDGNMHFQSKKGSPASLKTYISESWYEYPERNPLMLGFELNPNIYETLEVKRLSAEEVGAIGARDSAGHEIAILRTPIAEVTEQTSGKKVQYETWLDLDSGRVIQFTFYADGQPLMHRQNYVYQEISQGVFFPVAYDDLIQYQEGWTGFETERMEKITVNQPVERLPAY